MPKHVITITFEVDARSRDEAEKKVLQALSKAKLPMKWSNGYEEYDPSRHVLVHPSLMY
jgi:hypothetical protein